MGIILSGTTNDILVNGVSVVTEAEVNILVASAVPAGTIITFAAATAPTWYLKANGALLSRTTYAALFASIGTTFGIGDGSTTFALPDLRGYFPRGWDDGRGIDTSRVFGSVQQDVYGSHTHTGSTNSTGAHTHNISTGEAVGSWGVSWGATGSTRNTEYSGDHSHTVTVDASGGSETRPKNIALLYCIKY